MNIVLLALIVWSGSGVLTFLYINYRAIPIMVRIQNKKAFGIDEDVVREGDIALDHLKWLVRLSPLRQLLTSLIVGVALFMFYVYVCEVIFGIARAHFDFRCD